PASWGALWAMPSTASCTVTWWISCCSTGRIGTSPRSTSRMSPSRSAPSSCCWMNSCAGAVKDANASNRESRIMLELANNRIVLGLTGGIACYKLAEFVRRAGEHGATIDVVMTPAATQFITPVTMQALSGRPVFIDPWDARVPNNMAHINLTRGADAILIAPASTDFIDRKSTRLNSSHVKISYAVFFSLPRPPMSPLLPYTTLFRSHHRRRHDAGRHAIHHARDHAGAVGPPRLHRPLGCQGAEQHGPHQPDARRRCHPDCAGQYRFHGEAGAWHGRRPTFDPVCGTRRLPLADCAGYESGNVAEPRHPAQRGTAASGWRSAARARRRRTGLRGSG